MKDAKVRTTVIPANKKPSLDAIRRAERLSVLEELERKVDGTYFNAYPDFYRGVDEMKKAVLEHINKMKEAVK